VQQAGEQHPQLLGPLGETAQPATDRARRPTVAGRDRAMTGAGGLGQHGSADHRHPVRPTRQHRGRQQHMRATAARAPGPPRTVPDLPVLLTHRPRLGMPPRPQPARAPRAAQPPRGQRPIDLDRVGPYHQQRVPLRTKRRPSRPAKDREGRCVSRAWSCS
jgi:hypothetical protein